MEKNEKLIAEFKEKMEHYKPDWKRLIDAQWSNVSIDKFCDRMKKFRKDAKYTTEVMGKYLGYTKQNVSKIENKNIKTFPYSKLDKVATDFSTSVAYLIGLVDDESLAIDKSEYYFWEFPNTPFNEVKEYVIEKRLIYPMATFPRPFDNMLEPVTAELTKDHELLSSMHHIFKKEKSDGKAYRNIIKALAETL